MKRLLCAIMLMLALVFALSACSEDAPQEPIITVSDDGYLVVNGVKTEYEVNKEDVITIDNGYLVVNGVKTEHEVKNKNHSFGDWRLYNEDEEDCEKKLYYRTCTDCSTIEWREGKYADHDFNTEYLADNSFHWHKCKNCDAIDGRGEHALGDDGICTVCNEVVGATEGVVYHLSADGTYAIVLDYAGTAKRIKIAEEYKGLTVKEIYNGAFENTSITSVIIPDSVTSIGSSAFSGCFSLTSVVIPDSVTSIGEQAFSCCYSLTSVVIPDSVTNIGSSAFYYCHSLASVVIGDGVTSIGEEAFHGCTSLTSVVIGDSVTSIGYDAFSHCTSLTSIVIPDSVTSIGGSAFSYCSSLASVVIGDSVTSIGSSAFYGCDPALYTAYEYGKYLKSGDNPYAVLIELTNKNLSTYEIHPNTKIIAYGAFKNCVRLSSIKIPDSVTSIGSSAFYDCSSLTSIVIPDGVVSIGGEAFSGCSKLTSIVIPDSFTRIGGAAFSGCFSLTSVVIPDSVTSIGSYAFYDCSKLTDVYYTGTEADWADIVIGGDNYYLTNARKHYNYIPEE